MILLRAPIYEGQILKFFSNYRRIMLQINKNVESVFDSFLALKTLREGETLNLIKIKKIKKIAARFLFFAKEFCFFMLISLYYLISIMFNFWP